MRVHPHALYAAKLTLIMLLVWDKNATTPFLNLKITIITIYQSHNKKHSIIGARHKPRALHERLPTEYWRSTIAILRIPHFNPTLFIIILLYRISLHY